MPGRFPRTATFVAEATEYIRTHPMGEAEALLDGALAIIEEFKDICIPQLDAALTNEKESHRLTHNKVVRLKAHIEAMEEKNFWGWMHDGNDHPESLVCPIVIQPDDMRDILAQLAEAEAWRDTHLATAQAAEALAQSLSAQLAAWREAALGFVKFLTQKDVWNSIPTKHAEEAKNALASCPDPDSNQAGPVTGID